jgi:hypothetical protein
MANPSACKVKQHPLWSQDRGCPVRACRVRVDRLSLAATLGPEKWSPPGTGAHAREGVGKPRRNDREPRKGLAAFLVGSGKG